MLLMLTVDCDCKVDFGLSGRGLSAGGGTGGGEGVRPGRGNALSALDDCVKLDDLPDKSPLRRWLAVSVLLLASGGAGEPEGGPD